MTDNITLLSCDAKLKLAKIWHADGSIKPAANAAWFQATQCRIESVQDIRCVLDEIENRPRIALVKEAIAPDIDVNRLRRRCADGIDERTGRPFSAGLAVAPRIWIVLDIENVPRPASIDFHDGDALAEHVRSLLPDAFKCAACTWQLSGSSGHPSRLNEIRLHMFFVLDVAVFPSAWKFFFASSEFVDPSGFDKGKLIFTAAPIIHSGSDPITQRHGVLDGEPVVIVPRAVIEQSARISSGVDTMPRPTLSAPAAPMPQAAAAFVEIIAKSNILRSHHDAYRNDRARRLAFCAMLKSSFGIIDDASLAHAFHQACVGDNDMSGAHDAQEALRWAASETPSGRRFSVRKLLQQASVALHKAGDADTAVRAARLAMVFRDLELSAAFVGEDDCDE